MLNENLALHRQEIDIIDRQIVALLAERTRVVKKIMVLKKMRSPSVPVTGLSRY